MRGARGMPVIGPEGKKYPSQVAAARALGRSHTTVQYHLNTYGHLTYLGTGKGLPVAHGKKSWPSLAAAARELGYSRRTIEHHLTTHGNLDRLGCTHGRRWSRPVKVGPVTWPALKDAADYFGIHRVTMRIWLSDSATPAQKEKLIAGAMELHAKQSKARVTRGKGKQLEEAF